MQRNPPRDADESAPGARADDRPDFLPMEKPREGVAAGAGEFVDDHDLWTVDRHGWPRNVFSFSRRERREEFAAQFLRIKIRNLPTRIVTFVNDDPVFVELCGELLVKSNDAGDGCVRHVHIADAAAGRFRNFAPVFLHPIQVTRTGFAGRRLHRNFPRPFGSGFGIDFQGDEFSGDILEIRIDVLIRTRLLAVYGNQVVARLHLQSRFSQRRARGIVPVFAGIDLRNAEVAALRLEIRAEHSDADMRLRRLIAAADVGVRSAQLCDHFADDVIQVAAMRDPRKKRFIALANFLPIVTGHVRIPIKIALHAPGLVEYLAPLFAGIDLHLQFAEIELAVADFGFARCGFGDAVGGPGFVDDLLAFLVEVVAVDAFEQHLVFALGHVVNVEDIFRAAIAGAELPGFLRRGDVKEFVLARGQIAEDSGADWYWRDARADAVQIDLNRLDGFGFLLVLLFVFLFVRFLVARFRVGSFLVVFLLVLFFIFLFLGRFFLVALRFERRSFIGLQRDGENAVSRVVIEALIELPDARIKVARGNEIEILPVFVEDGIVVAIEAGRNFGDFLRAQRIKEDIVGAAAVRLGIGKPQAVRRPTAVEDIAVVGLVDQGRLFVVEADDPELMQLVPVKQLLAVWRPDRPVAVDAPIVGDARFPPAHLRTRVELKLAGLVGKIRDPLSIG